MKTLKNKRSVWVVALLILVLAVTTAVVFAANVTIDNFSLADQTATSTWNTGDSLPRPQVCDYASPTAPDTLGGHRDVCIQITDASTNGDQARLRVTSQQLALSSDSSLDVTGIVQWDGSDATPALDTAVGLGSVDLTDSATNDGIVVRIVNADGVPVEITLRIYTDGSNWAEQTIQFGSAVSNGSEIVDLFFPFSGFSGGAGTMNPASVNAVEAEITSLSQGPDLNIDLIEATTLWDYGDLPDTYGTLAASNGARHRTTSDLRLGTSVDVEDDGAPNATATGDDAAEVLSGVSDEDGVVRQPSLTGGSSNGGWTNGTVASFNGGALDITITGGSGVPQVFVDFGSGLTEVVLRDLFGNPLGLPGTPLAEGTTTVRFDIPAGTFDGTNPTQIPVRVRLSAAGGLTATGPAGDGEVEDYVFGFGPTAVTLSAPVSASSSGGWVAPLLLVSVLGIVTLGLWQRNKRRAAPEAPAVETAVLPKINNAYESPAVIYEGELTTRAGSPTGLDPNGIDPSDLFD